MTQKLFRFCRAALLYWLVAAASNYVLEMPDKVAGVAVFIPAALGVYFCRAFQIDTREGADGK